MKLLLLPLFLFSSVSAVASECLQNVNELGAKYLVSESVLISQKTKKNHRHFNLWRKNTEVAHEHLDSNITEIWNLVSDGRVKPVRYFDEDKRGIEYQPDEVNNGKGDRNWNGKYQLFTDRYIASMKKESVNGQGCDKQEVYTSMKNDVSIRLVWLPAVKLPKFFEEKSSDKILRWELQELVKDAPQVNQAFASRQNYLTTDYADIGDNESDPFLIKMINLGFVSHGASGFYDANGVPLEAEHGHAH